MSLQFGERLRALLDEPLPVTLATTRADGTVQLAPVWYEYRDGFIWLNGGPKRDWFLHMQRDPRATLLVLDPENMFRWVQIQAKLHDTTFEGADDQLPFVAGYAGLREPGDVPIRDPQRIGDFVGQEAET